MLQEKIYEAQKQIEEREAELRKEIKDYASQFCGKNFYNAMKEVKKEFRKIEVVRYNITFKIYHPMRTVRPKWEIQEKSCRQNWLDTDEPTYYKEFDEKIKRVHYQTVIMDGAIYPSVCFVLDDSEEFVIEY